MTTYMAHRADMAHRVPIRVGEHYAVTCEVCGRSAPIRVHPCRFERACRCWYGEPCKPKGDAA